MISPPIVAIYGNSDSGKTGLIEDLVGELVEEGYEVCTIKHSPSRFSLDEEGKDTWRYRDAGSALTVLATDIETAFLYPEEKSLEEIAGILTGAGHSDIIIAEGFKDADVAKIAVGDIESRPGTIHEFDGDLAGVKQQVKKLIAIREIEAELPGLDCARCGYEDCESLAEAIYEGEMELADCEVREQRRVNLKVNGKPIPLENFPARFVEGGLKGMLRSLKGVEGEIDQISLEIES